MARRPVVVAGLSRRARRGNPEPCRALDAIRVMIALMSVSGRPAAPPAVEGADALAMRRSLADPTAFDAIWERHHDAVFRYVVSRLGIDQADDVVAEVFLQAYANRRRFDPSLCPTALPWLLGIATRRIGRQRDAQRRWTAQCAAAVEQDRLPSDDDGAASRVDAARLAPALATAIAQLRPKDREPLLLHVLAGLAYEEVAVALGVPLGTVRSRISRARQRLAGLLDGVAR
jgi:RNA polymerase sigma-70 factor (ECF subfamily)